MGAKAGEVGVDEELFVPDVTDTARVAGGIDARAPIPFRGAATGGEVDMFAVSEGGGFLYANDVVFETEIRINVLL